MRKENIHISVKPEWEFIIVFRNFIKDYLSLRIKDDNQIYDISFNVSELVENAVKYSDNGNVIIDMTYDENNEIQLVVKNKADPKQAKELKNNIKKISKNSKEDILKEKFNSQSFWEEGTGSLGLFMINERISGELRFSYNDHIATVGCKFSLKEKI